MQQYIKNLKDPTKKSIYLNKAPQLPILLQILLITFALVNHCQATATHGERLRRDYTSITAGTSGGTINNRIVGVQQNVSCIAHDAKFTCDCHNVEQHKQMPSLMGYVFQVEISNCNSLSIDANVLEETQGLRKVTFKNIKNLILNKYALAFPRYASNTPLIVEFEEVNFEIIDSHAINGNIEEISFIGGRIDIIHPFGFTTLKDRAMLLKMDNVHIKRIESQAFKKFAVEQMEITNCHFESNVPSKAFYELEVLNALIISNNKFNEVHSRAFSFRVISKLSITNNYFTAVDAEWFEAHVRESVQIRENHFGLTSQISFKALQVHRDYMSSERLEFRFSNNTVQFVQQPRPLDFNERFALNLKQLQYNNAFACSEVDLTQKPPKPKNQFFQKYADDIYFHYAFTADGKNAAKSNNQSFVTLNKIIEKDCQQPSYLLYIILGVVALVILLVIIAIIVWVYLVKKRKRRKLDVVQPEPRTYKETQIIYQIENAGLLKTDL